jgi:hypothetical protein
MIYRTTYLLLNPKVNLFEKDTNHISNLWYKNNNLLTCMINVILNNCITQ